MKKISILFLSLFVGLTALAQNAKPLWNKVLSDSPQTFQIQLLSSSENSIQVNVQVPGFFTTAVATPQGEANVITVPKALSTAHAGEPDMPMTGLPLMIGDKARMKARVVSAQYQDFEGIEVAPSKGDFSRQIDPATVPYTYGTCYSQNAFFPASNLDLYEPYLIRDFRGQNMAVYPFAYNPVSKTLRVYYDMTVELYKIDNKGENVIESRRSNEVKMDPDFQSVYAQHFLNYEENAAKYTVLGEEGDLLIICHNDLMSAMTDFVNWKKTRGIHTTIVSTSTTGTTYSAIKTYIQNQYNANNNLTHVLLVGDVAQIPGYPFTAGSGYNSYSGKGDNPYGQVVGSDLYNDLFIGRFSASTAAQVTTQVNRILTYERDLTTSANWCQKGLGISTTEGSGGHNSEDDYQHIENLRTDLLNYGYSTVYQDYASVSGYPSSTTTTISSHINSGVGIINYCNHGEETGWQSHYYMNSNVNALTNNNMLPFIFSVACLVGKYDYASGDCFAETWMHATNGSNPTGAIGGMFSYISQPWIPPMWAQDEFVDILCELKSNNKKHSLGGAAINSLFSIFDHYSTSDNAAKGTYQAWVLYGDPTLMMRTKTPQAMTVTHSGIIDVTETSYTVSVSNGDCAVATITNPDHEIMGKATVSNGTATISITGDLSLENELTLCVFGYNKVTHLSTIEVVAGEQYTIDAETDPVEGGTVKGAGTYYEFTECTLTATANRGYAFTHWTRDNTTVSQEPAYTFTVSGNATYTAHFEALSAHNIETVAVEHGSITFEPATAYPGETVTLTAQPEAGYILRSWLVYKAGDLSVTVPVSGNQFVMPDYDVCIAALFIVPTGGEITIGSGTNTSAYLPTYAYYKYSLTQQIYTAAELGGEAGTIIAIAFKNSTNATDRTLDIYLKHTTKTAFSSTTGWETMGASNKVYSGVVSFPSSGWFTIYLDTPFEYDGTSNLMICVDDNSNHDESMANVPKCYVYTTGNNRALRIFKDEVDFNPCSATALASYTGSFVASNNQLKVTMASQSDQATINVFPDALEGFSYEQGQGPSQAQSFTLLASASENLVVTAPAHYEVSDTEEGPYTSSITLEAAPVINATLYVRLKADLNAGSYNEPLQLQSGSTTQTVALRGEVIQTNHFVYDENLYAANMNVFAVIVIDGEEQRVESLEVGAFSGEACRGSEHPLYCPPVDRYIVPLIVYGEEGDPITFKLYDHDQELELELTCLSTLTFNEAGLGSISDPVVLAFTSGSIPATIEQSITLDAGWNWFSCYLECDDTLFEALKEAIAATNSTAMIKSMDYSILLQNGSWSVSELTLNTESLFMINQTAPVTFTLTAAPVDPTLQPITLVPGWNWIGFPSTQPLSLEQAFAGINPSNGDMIKNMDAASSYSGGAWQGSMNQLEPGKGYMYYNNSSEVKTLVF